MFNPLNLIVHFGNFLAQQLGKPEKSGAICGFLRLALKKEYGTEGVDNLTPDKLKQVLQGELQQKLMILKVTTLSDAITATMKEVTRNQSLFTMNQA
ncbi:hypothetical protein NEF87_002573 [Candidatus Lokiarchaeum ossiferum]|uniref:Uncharacterized protein n=1 Tax=Candidatus Lokiarchaeum ossiferum TaxID=2951803 RepID=A0ABY6HRZ7_9ARCH|nr:hypothetical protein NEF87_002573 [Candidatus Lokiarchaeum sp. B-35]